MINKKSWKEFRESGLLWFTNMILHTFGWAIILEVTDGKLMDVYPARVKYRGFSEQINTDGYKNVEKYFVENGKEILKESEEDSEEVRGIN